MQEGIRAHFKRLAPNIIQTRVSEDEARRFKARKQLDPSVESCTPDRFRLYLDGPPRSEWNRSAARVFARSFVDHISLSGGQRRLALIEAEKLALARIKTIKAEYLHTLLSNHMRDVQSQAYRRRTRKANVSVLYNITLVKLTMYLFRSCSTKGSKPAIFTRELESTKRL